MQSIKGDSVFNRYNNINNNIMKTVQEIKKELQTIEHDIKLRLELFIKKNPDISIYMDFSTETMWDETICGEKINISKNIKTELNISID